MNASRSFAVLVGAVLIAGSLALSPAAAEGGSSSDWMDAMHDSAGMQQMHDQMPAALREQCDQMHERMKGSVEQHHGDFHDEMMGGTWNSGGMMGSGEGMMSF